MPTGVPYNTRSYTTQMLTNVNEVHNMRRFSAVALLMVITLLLAACGGDVEGPGLEATDTAEPTEAPAPTATPAATGTPQATDTPEPTETVAPTETATEPPPTEPPPTETSVAVAPEPGEAADLDEPEAILIEAPGNTSRVTSPVRVAGEADPTFEQTLVVRIVSIDGQELVQAPATIAADLGQRGPFEVEVPFEVQDEVQAWIQVYATSARDGGITHLSSVAVTLAAEGEPDIVEATRPTGEFERIIIDSPENGDTVEGGIVTVTGRGLAGFEQTLVVELLDEAGGVIEMQPIIVDAPDLGQPGSFEAELAYSVSEETPARVQVRDPSPAFGGDVHLTSVELFLAP